MKCNTTARTVSPSMLRGGEEGAHYGLQCRRRDGGGIGRVWEAWIGYRKMEGGGALRWGVGYQWGN